MHTSFFVSLALLVPSIAVVQAALYELELDVEQRTATVKSVGALIPLFRIKRNEKETYERTEPKADPLKFETFPSYNITEMEPVHTIWTRIGLAQSDTYVSKTWDMEELLDDDRYRTFTTVEPLVAMLRRKHGDAPFMSKQAKKNAANLPCEHAEAPFMDRQRGIRIEGESGRTRIELSVDLETSYTIEWIGTGIRGDTYDCIRVELDDEETTRCTGERTGYTMRLSKFGEINKRSFFGEFSKQDFIGEFNKRYFIETGNVNYAESKRIIQMITLMQLRQSLNSMWSYA